MQVLMKIFLTLMLLFAGTAAAEADDRSIALILDASGSMQGRLDDGTRKIVAAKAAVVSLVERLDQDVDLSYRAYGHQYHRDLNRCDDTQLLVGFGRLSEQKSAILSATEGLLAQGYTPITQVLGLAAEELEQYGAAGARQIVLVSDGKETCEGDPCLLAQQLADANADLSIHTIGFGADFQANEQLKCIADVARGTYSAAESSDELLQALQLAAVADLTQASLTVQADLPGALRVENSQFHNVINAETGEVVGTIDSDTDEIALPPGIYHVEFGDDLLWRSIRVQSDETTVIAAGRLSINPNQFHKVYDPETGRAVAEYATDVPYLALPPGEYDVSFDDAVWRAVEIASGGETLLNPAIVQIANSDFHSIIDRTTGEKAGNYTSSDS
ncbi:VWA domain-containing protein, partial [bacterium]|nr:VWA domain-containing protein [bacterium]